MDEVTTPFEALVRRGREISREISSLGEELADIKTRVSAMVSVGESKVVDEVAVTKRLGNRTFDPVIALSLLDAEERAACKREQFDFKLVRAAVKDKGVEDACLILKDGVDPVFSLGS